MKSNGVVQVLFTSSLLLVFLGVSDLWSRGWGALAAAGMCLLGIVGKAISTAFDRGSIPPEVVQAARQALERAGKT